MPEEEFKHIVRIAGKDLTGTKPVYRALSELKGVNFAFARAVAYAAGIDPFMRLGDLKNEQVENIEKILENPLKHEIPSWMFNRRKDFESGKDIHLIGHHIDLAVRADIGRERHIRSRRGIRHELGLPVRGQRTRTTGRKGLSVGVKRKEVRVAEAKKEKKK
jgi:small subunit ribosomal protein S13